MSLASLFTESATLLTASNGTADEYGNTATTYSAGTVYLGRLEQRSAQEVTDGRDTFVSDWVWFTFPSTPVTGRDRLVVSGRTFEVVGLPAMQRSPRGDHHLQVNLRFVE